MESSVIVPPFRHYLGEARIVSNWIAGRRREDDLAARYPGSGARVIVLPGLFTSDRRTRMLRRVIGKAGYEAHGWGLGRNMPIKADVLERFGAQVARVRGDDAARVILIGWSLGGLIARAYAAHAPDDIAAVITMGTPFSGNPRSNRAWQIYEMFADHKVDAPPLAFDRSAKPPVPTAAIWSSRDGVIAVPAAKGLPHERDIEVEIACGHFAMSCAPDALEAVLKLLGGGLAKRPS